MPHLSVQMQDQPKIFAMLEESQKYSQCLRQPCKGEAKIEKSKPISVKGRGRLSKLSDGAGLAQVQGRVWAG